MSAEKDRAAVTDEVRARMFAKFRCLRHRQTIVTFVPASLLVEAAHPSELEDATVRAAARLAEACRPS